MRKSFSPHPPNKNFLCICDKNFLMEICRNIQTFAFQVLWKCSFWVHRNCKVQVFYLTPTRDRFSGKFVKWVKFLVVMLEYIFYVFFILTYGCYNITRWGEVCKMNFLGENCIVLVSCLRFIWITNSSDYSSVWMNCESLAY